MVNYQVILTKQAIKDIAKLKTINLSEKARETLKKMETNPYYFQKASSGLPFLRWLF